MVWKCGVCEKKECLTLRELLQHINREHGSNPNFHVFCGIDECPRGYSVYSSFYKHIRKQHPEHYEKNLRLHRSRMLGGNTECSATKTQDINIVGRGTRQGIAEYQNPQEDESASNGSDIDEPEMSQEVSQEVSQENSECDVAVENENDLNIMAAEFIFGMKEKHELTQKSVDELAQGYSSLFQASLHRAKKQIVHNLDVLDHEESKEQSIDIVEHAFLNIHDPFNNLTSSYMQNKFRKQEFPFIQEQSVRLGYRLERQLIETHVRSVRVPEYVYYLPIKESLGNLFSNSLIHDICSQERCIIPEGFVLDIWDGSYIKNHPIFKDCDTNCLLFQLYYDDLEICSALSNATRSMSLFYYRLLNMNLLYRSQVESIRLFAVVEKKYLNKYGMSRILRPFTEAMIELNTNGWDLDIEGQLVHFTGGLVNLIGDTPAINAMGGFKKGVGFSYIKCRHCDCKFPEMQKNFQETDFHILTLNEYKQKCDRIERAKNIDKDTYDHISKLHGINETSILLKCPEFDLCEALPQDIMHVFCEGVAPYELKAILKKYIFQNETFTLEQFNDRLRLFFAQIRYDSVATPIEIQKQTLQKTDGSLKQNSSQMNALITAIPFIFSGLVSERSNLFSLLIDLVKLRNFLFSPVISHGTLGLMRTFISEHLSTFKSTFHEMNIIPKQHYLIHLPSQIEKFGPAIRYNAFRFESKHKGLKRKLRASQNYKNLGLSVIQIAQREDSVQSNQINPKLHTLFKDDFITGSCKLVEKEVLHEIENEIDIPIINCYTTKYITLCGNKFVANYTLVPVYIENFNFIFGKIREIFLFDMSKTIFKLEMFRTVTFEEKLQAIQIEQQQEFENFTFIKPESLLDHKPYFSIEFLGKNYVPLHYDLLDMIDLFQRGEGNYHNKIHERV